MYGRRRAPPQDLCQETVSRSDPRSRLRSAFDGCDGFVSTDGGRAMLKALVPVDGSGNSLCAVRHVIKLVQDREPLEIHLLNVQPPLPGDVTSFVAKNNVRDFHLEEGEKA